MHQRPNGDHACASCKHQRKKCKEDCPLAPFFPVNLSAEFRSVHKTFGVSNVAKQLKKIDGEEGRKSCAEALIWVANCFESDPVQGPYGEHQRLLAEYRRALEELNYLKAQDQYYNRFTTTSGLPPGAAAAVVNSQCPTNLFEYNNNLPAAGPLAVVMANGQLSNNGWNNNGCRAAPVGTPYHNNNINGGVISSVAGYHENGNLRADNHHGGPINVQFPYHNATDNNGGDSRNGVVQDSDEGQNNTPEPQVIHVPSQQQRKQPPPPPPPQRNLEQLIIQNSQNMGNNELQDQKARPNGALIIRQHRHQYHHQQQHYPMTSFSQQSFNAAGPYHQPTCSDANPAGSTTSTPAREMDNDSRWSVNSGS